MDYSSDLRPCSDIGMSLSPNGKCSEQALCISCRGLVREWTAMNELPVNESAVIEHCVVSLRRETGQCAACRLLGNLPISDYSRDPVAPHAMLASPTSLAYVVHTSGSTGEPKEVWVPHCCIVPNVLGLRTRLGLCPDDVVFNAAPLTFDPSVVEVCGYLYVFFIVFRK